MQFTAKLTQETRILADLLSAVPLGGSIAYATLSAAARFDVRKRRYCLGRARQIALDETGAVFDTRRNYGLVRLGPDQIPSIGSAARRHIRRTARRSNHAMQRAIAGFNDVDAKIYRRYLDESAVLGLAERLASQRYMRRIAERAQPVPVPQIARLMFQMLGAV